MLRLMARPSPVPPFSRASEESTCSNRAKTLSSLSSGMPAALVADARTRRSARDGVARTSPRSRVGELDGVAEQVEQGLDDPVGVGVSPRPSTCVDHAPSPRPPRRSPASGRPPRRSGPRAGWPPSSIGIDAGLDPLDVQDLVDQPGQPLAADQGDLDHPARPRGSAHPSAPPAISPSEPRIAVSGVRSSWLTIETNSLFSRSTSRRWVTSRKTTTAPMASVRRRSAGSPSPRPGSRGRRRDVAVLLGVGRDPVADRLGDVALVDRVGRAVRLRRRGTCAWASAADQLGAAR